MKKSGEPAMDRRHICAMLLAVSLSVFCAAGLYAAPGESATRFTAESVKAIAADASAAAVAVLKKTGGTALTAALVDARGIVWQGQFGLADKSAGLAANPDTMFGIGSVSKMFATVSTMILADRGLVELDAPLERFLPEFRMADPGYARVTVRMLLNHASGLPGGDLRNAGSPKPFPEYAEQVLRTISTQRLKHEPGFMSVYANDGFTVLERLILAVSGTPFTEFVEREIFRPLGMEHSRYTLEKFPEDSFAHAYMGGEAMPWLYWNMYGSGGLMSTASDMGKFAMMLAGGGALGDTRILSVAAVRAMGQDQMAGTFNPLPGDYIRFGLGWDTVSQPGLLAVGLKGWQKGGDISGVYGATMIVAAEEGLAAVAMGASGVGSGEANIVAETLILRALVERGRLTSMPAKAATAAARTIPVKIAQRVAVDGFYASSGSLYRATVSPNGVLTVESRSGAKWIPLFSGQELRADGWYSPDSPDGISVGFVDAGGSRYMAIRKSSGIGHYLITLLYAEKLESPPPMPSSWVKRMEGPWLLASEELKTAEPDDETDPRMNLSSLPEIPGYLLCAWEGIQTLLPLSGGDVDTGSGADRAAMFLLIPEAQGRDLNDLIAEKVGDVEYLRLGGFRFRALATVRDVLLSETAGTGTSTLIIGEEGLGEWRKLPSGGRVSVEGAGMWRLYGADFALLASGAESGSAKLADGAAGSYIVVYGKPGQTVSLSIGR